MQFYTIFLIKHFDIAYDIYFIISRSQIPLMENKMKWDSSKKKKKFPSIEIEMTSTNINSNDEKTTEEAQSLPMFQVWSSKHNTSSPSPVRGVKEQNFTAHSGDSGIESVQVCLIFTKKKK